MVKVSVDSATALLLIVTETHFSAPSVVAKAMDVSGVKSVPLVAVTPVDVMAGEFTSGRIKCVRSWPLMIPSFNF